MKIGICDDELYYVQKIESMVRTYFSAQHMEITLFCDTNAERFSQNDLSALDIVFLDVLMDTVNGIDVARALRVQNQKAVLVYISQLIDYAPMGYEVNAFRYLLKSNLENTFYECMQAVMRRLETQNQTYLLKTELGILSLALNNVLYIESQKRLLLFHVQNQERSFYQCYEKITVAQQQLSEKGFLRIHKSYLVNMAHIKYIRNTEIALKENTVLPVSRQNDSSILQAYLQWQGRTI
ncbi:MAG: LytTR family DNA-binding domain-containing protein [Ruthenibacterium sp.]